MDKKIVLVSGGNRGIGLEICRQLSGRGALVILSARDYEKARSAAVNFNDDLILIQLDVTSDESVMNAVNFI